jgi:hypothetical protein
MRRFVGGIALTVVVLTLGCGERPRSRVHGTVTYQGKPLGGAIVTFFGSDNQTYSASTGPDGAYEVTRVPHGTVRVAVQIPPARPKPRPDPGAGKSNERAMAEDRAKAAARPPADPAPKGPAAANLPDKYNSPNTSELSFELTTPDHEYKIELK